MTGTTTWAAPRAHAPLDATVSVPASKSLMARSLVLAGLSEQATTVHNPLLARDSWLMADALRALGASVTTPRDGPWTIEPGRGVSGGVVDCGLSGTVMRFVPPMAALVRAEVRFDGDRRARERPMAGLLDALRDLGVAVSPAGACALPFTVHGAGSVHGGRVDVDAGESSQYVSGLLLAGCRYRDGLEVQAVAAPPSTPHIDMTLAALRARGVRAAQTGPTRWRVWPAVPRGGDVTIEPDLSNAAPFLAAAVVTGGRVRLTGWPSETTQPAPALLRLLTGFGASVEARENTLTVTGPAAAEGLGTIDMGDVGELVPTVAAVAALADAPTTITGVAHLRGHETDRLAALDRSLTALGGQVEQTADGLRITPRPLQGAQLSTEGDHRMATFAAIIGLRVPGVVVDDVSVTDKTMPAFPALWAGMLP